ncbi:YciI family protein [Myxococcus sp. AB025B]|uniref:YciI family protein n=1 Tax=Myxococcus sp. AB025B TaxID=2562794 RepID=UPI001142344C|nr:YciI family protein [Myxococcus sp. AB025B]
MTYMLLVMEESKRKRSRTPEEGRREMERMMGFVRDLQARGLWKGSDSLRSVSEGVRIEVRDHQRTLRDGPFAESKEVVGGYVLFDCASREEALAIASQCPAAEWSTVELREVGVCYEEEDPG